MQAALVIAIFVLVATGFACVWRAGEQVGSVRGSRHDVDPRSFPPRLVVARAKPQPYERPHAHVKMMGVGFSRMETLDPDDAEALAALIEEAAERLP